MDKSISKAILTLNAVARTSKTYIGLDGKEKPFPLGVSDQAIADARRCLSRLSGLELVEIIIAHRASGNGLDLFPTPRPITRGEIEALEVARLERADFGGVRSIR